jgi:hypothetical protein
MQKKKYVCSVSGKVIPAMRVEYLMESGLPEDKWTTVEHSQVQRKKGIYMGGTASSEDDIGEAGELVIVDKVYDDSVRTILAGSDDSDDKSSEE